MNPVLRNSAAHVVVDDLDAPRLDESDAHHLFRVLRVRDGAVVTATNGRGSWRECRARGRDLIEPVGEINNESARAFPIGVAFVPVKAEKPEHTIRQLVEVGVDEIFVVAPTKRAVAGARDRLNDRADRIVREACMQSRRVFLPAVHLGVPLVDVIALSGAAVADPDGVAPSAEHRLLIVGPEGGFDTDEIPPSITRINIGPAVLRAETAALVAGARLVGLHA
ncbi:MAG: RsmE family RNA methyltransferase [Actinomycetota bacterium]